MANYKNSESSLPYDENISQAPSSAAPAQSPPLRTNPYTNVSPIERSLSATVGIALAAWAVERLTKSHLAAGITSLALGSGLLWRGASGHCPLYSSMGINTNEQSGKTTSTTGEEAKSSREPERASLGSIGAGSRQPHFN